MKTSTSFFLSRLRAGIVALMITSLLSACTTTRVTSFGQPTPAASEIQPGDQVVCRMQDGSSVQFTVTETDATTIRGKDQEVKKADVASVEIRRFSGAKTVITVAALVALGVVLADALPKMGALAAMSGAN